MPGLLLQKSYRATPNSDRVWEVISDRILTTFFEKDGMVTAFAFDQPMTLTKDRRWWDNVYCLVVTSRDGKPVVLAAQKEMHSPWPSAFACPLPAKLAE